MILLEAFLLLALLTKTLQNALIGCRLAGNINRKWRGAMGEMVLCRTSMRRNKLTDSRRKRRHHRPILSALSEVVDLYRSGKKSEVDDIFAAARKEVAKQKEPKFFIWCLTPAQLPAAFIVADNKTVRLFSKFERGRGLGWIVAVHHATYAEKEIGPNHMGIFISAEVQQRLLRKKAPGYFLEASTRQMKIFQ